MSLATIFGLKILKFFVADPLGPRSSAISTLDPGEIRTRVKNSGSATLDKERHIYLHDINVQTSVADPGC
jgi:hypothetical protein